MTKFTSKENRDFWDKFAKKSKDNLHGAHSDKNMVELENNFITKTLKSLNPKNILDIGCGNGQRTIQFSKYAKNTTIGIDYSEELIKGAKLSLSKQSKTIQEKASFEVQDIQNFTDKNQYDVIISCRCFVNQTSYANQIKLFKKLHKQLKPKGSLILAEVSLEGVKRLSELRIKHGLGKQRARTKGVPNLHISEDKVFPKMKTLFNIKKIERGGVYYYISRVLYPTIISPKEPDSNSKINEVGLKSAFILENEFKSSTNSFEKFGSHLLVHLI